MHRYIHMHYPEYSCYYDSLSHLAFCTDVVLMFGACQAVFHQLPLVQATTYTCITYTARTYIIRMYILTREFSRPYACTMLPLSHTYTLTHISVKNHIFLRGTSLAFMQHTYVASLHGIMLHSGFTCSH